MWDMSHHSRKLASARKKQLPRPNRDLACWRAIDIGRLLGLLWGLITDLQSWVLIAFECKVQ